MKPWIPWGAGLAALLAIAEGLTCEHRKLLEAQASAESATLKLKGQIVEDTDTYSTLHDAIARLLTENIDLRASYEAASKAAPRATPGGAASFDTGSVVVPRRNHVTAEGEHGPHSKPFPIPNGHSVEGIPPGAAPPASGGDSLGTIGDAFKAACLLKEDDRAQIRVDVLELVSPNNSRIFVGKASAWRVAPAPSELLFSGTFNAHLSTVEGLIPEEKKPAWGAYVSGACRASGCGPGIGLMLPPFRLLGVALEATAGLESSGGLAARGQVGLRF